MELSHILNDLSQKAFFNILLSISWKESLLLNPPNAV